MFSRRGLTRMISRPRVMDRGVAPKVPGCELDQTAGAAVDIEGTVWVWCEPRTAWCYLTWHGLSFDDHPTPPDRYGPYTVLDGPAAEALRTVATSIA